LRKKYTIQTRRNSILHFSFLMLSSWQGLNTPRILHEYILVPFILFSIIYNNSLWPVNPYCMLQQLICPSIMSYMIISVDNVLSVLHNHPSWKQDEDINSGAECWPAPPWLLNWWTWLTVSLFIQVQGLMLLWILNNIKVLHRHLFYGWCMWGQEASELTENVGRMAANCILVDPPFYHEDELVTFVVCQLEHSLDEDHLESQFSEGVLLCWIPIHPERWRM
jgi:hypothetical protein